MQFLNNLNLILILLCLSACVAPASNDSDTSESRILLTTHIAADLVQGLREADPISRNDQAENLLSQAGITLTSELELLLTTTPEADISISEAHPTTQNLTIHLDRLELHGLARETATPMQLTARIYLSDQHLGDTSVYQRVKVTGRHYGLEDWRDSGSSLMKYELRQMSRHLANSALDMLYRN